MSEEQVDKFTITARVTFEISLDIQANSYNDADEKFRDMTAFDICYNGDGKEFTDLDWEDKSRSIINIAKR